MVTNLTIVFLSLEQQIDEIRWHATLSDRASFWVR